MKTLGNKTTFGSGKIGIVLGSVALVTFNRGLQIILIHR